MRRDRKFKYFFFVLTFLVLNLDEVSSLNLTKSIYKRVVNEREIVNFDFQNTGLQAQN